MSGKYNSIYNQVHLLGNSDYIELYSSYSEDELYCICVNSKFDAKKAEEIVNKFLSEYSLCYKISSMNKDFLYYDEYNEIWSIHNHEEKKSEKLWIFEVEHFEDNVSYFNDFVY